MILVRRDPSKIPERVLKVAERAQAQLEALPPEQRVDFIKKKTHIWRGFKRYLKQMSYGKCWYSEALGPQSPYDVDHFRPKAEARRSDQGVDEGYPWLAFDWDNFRYSAELSNRPNKDEETGETCGKGSWFPLLDGSPVATWDNRCIADERPLLLDPTIEADVALIAVGSDGRMMPSRVCVGTNKRRVETSVRCYGLDLPDLREARLKTMRDIEERVEALLGTTGAGAANDDLADQLPVDVQLRALRRMLLPDSPFSLAARAKLIELGLADLLPGPEDFVDLAA